MKKFYAKSYVDRIKAITDNPSKYELTYNAVCVCRYLQHYRPTYPVIASPYVMSSYDIVTALKGTCKVEINEVAQVMCLLGYSLDINSYNSPVWSMYAVDAPDEYPFYHPKQTSPKNEELPTFGAAQNYTSTDEY